jgi:hypothetical protein
MRRGVGFAGGRQGVGVRRAPRGHEREQVAAGARQMTTERQEVLESLGGIEQSNALQVAEQRLGERLFLRRALR